MNYSTFSSIPRIRNDTKYGIAEVRGQVKVKDLIKELTNINQDNEVYIAVDAEGNSYKQVHAVDIEAFISDDGKVYYPSEVHDDDLKYMKQKVTIIWPAD